MNTLKFEDKKIHLCVNGDSLREIVIAPDDIGFINRYYGFIDFLSNKQKDYIEKATDIDNASLDKQRDGFKLMQEMCEDIKEQVDVVFGVGTSAKVFGDAIRLDMFEQFLNGIVPYVKKAREDKIKKYIEIQGKNVMK